MGIQMAGGEEKLAQKNQRAFSSKKQFLYNNSYLPLCSNLDHCSGGVHIIFTFVNKKAIYLCEKMI